MARRSQARRAQAILLSVCRAATTTPSQRPGLKTRCTGGSSSGRSMHARRRCAMSLRQKETTRYDASSASSGSPALAVRISTQAAVHYSFYRPQPPSRRGSRAGICVALDPTAADVTVGTRVEYASNISSSAGSGSSSSAGDAVGGADAASTQQQLPTTDAEAGRSARLAKLQAAASPTQLTVSRAAYRSHVPCAYYAADWALTLQRGCAMWTFRRRRWQRRPRLFSVFTTYWALLMWMRSCQS